MILLLMGVCGSGKSTIGERLSEKLQWPFEDGDHYHPASNKAKMFSGTPLDDEDRYEWLINLHQVIDKWHTSNQHGIMVCSALKLKYRQVLIWGSKADYRSSQNMTHKTKTSECQTSKEHRPHQQGAEEVKFQSSNMDFDDNNAFQLSDAEKKSPPCSADTLKDQNLMPSEIQHHASVNQRKEQPDVLFVHLKGSFDVIASRLSLRKGHFFNPTLLQSQFDTLEDLARSENGVVINIEKSEDQIVSDILECLVHQNLE